MLDLGDDVLIAIGSVSAQWATLEYYMSRVRAALDAHGRVPKSATSDGDKAKGPAVPVAVFGGVLPTADVLKVISHSTFDLQTVLDTLTESAARLCEAETAGIFRPRGDFLQFVAAYGFAGDYQAYLESHPVPMDHGSLTGRTMLECKTIHIHDVLADPEYKLTETARIGRYRTLLGVPLMRKGTPIGVISLQRYTVRPFTDKQIELVTTFADQAVIAIENVRLFDAEQARTRELSESLEQQTATSEVLQVISSSPGELEPVFRAMLENATRICKSDSGILWLAENGGLRPVVYHGVPSEVADVADSSSIVYPHPEIPLGRGLTSKQIVHVPNLREDPSYLKGIQPLKTLVDSGGALSLLMVPMLNKGDFVGTISIYRREVHPFSQKEIELVENFAAQAVIA